MNNTNYFQTSICANCKHNYWEIGMKYGKCLIKDKSLDDFIASCDCHEIEITDEQNLTT